MIQLTVSIKLLRSTLVTFVTFLVLTPRFLFGQYATTGLDLDGDIATWYDRMIGKQNAQVLEGTYYEIKYAALEHHQYFESVHWIDGELVFEGQYFANVSLLYNVFDDVLLIQNKALLLSSIEATLLNQDRVDGFTLAGHHFVNLRDSLSPTLGAGFYELLFDGANIDFYIKRSKSEFIRDNQLSFEYVDKYFLFDGNQFIRYNSKKDLFKHFSEEKNKMKAYGKTLKTNLKKGEEDGMIKWLEFCDNLLGGK